MTSFLFCPSVSQSSKRIDWSWSKVQHRLKDPIYLLRVHFLFNFSFNLFTIRSCRMANCTHFDRLDFAVHGILLTSVGLAGLVANVLCLLVLHRPALRVGRQVSLKCRYIGLFSTRHNCKICESLCFWHVISQLGIVKFDEISKLEIAAVSALCIRHISNSFSYDMPAT